MTWWPPLWENRTSLYITSSHHLIYFYASCFKLYIVFNYYVIIHLFIKCQIFFSSKYIFVNLHHFLSILVKQLCSKSCFVELKNGYHHAFSLCISFKTPCLCESKHLHWKKWYICRHISILPSFLWKSTNRWESVHDK